MVYSKNGAFLTAAFSIKAAGHGFKSNHFDQLTFDSRTLLSPILSASEVQSTSKTLLLPMIMTGTVPASDFPESEFRLMIRADSSMRLLSPMMIGPDSAII